MTENEYVLHANRVRLSTALTILGNVMPGEDYGISDEKLAEITKPLCIAVS